MAALADYLQGDSSQVLALSEVDVPETAGVGYHNQWRARGRQAALSTPEPNGCRVALVSEVPFKHVQLCRGPALTRHVAGLFDLSCPPAAAAAEVEPSQGSQITETVLIVAFYGQASDEAAAQSQVEDVLSSAEATGFRYVILGDFNLEQTQGRLGYFIAQGAARAGDECACGRPLPPTGPPTSTGCVSDASTSR